MDNQLRFLRLLLVCLMIDVCQIQSNVLKETVPLAPTRPAFQPLASPAVPSAPAFQPSAPFAPAHPLVPSLPTRPLVPSAPAFQPLAPFAPAHPLVPSLPTRPLAPSAVPSAPAFQPLAPFAPAHPLVPARPLAPAPVPAVPSTPGFQPFVPAVPPPPPPPVIPIEAACFKCMCWASSQCAPRACHSAGPTQYYCGSYLISWAYWADAGKPQDNPHNPHAFERCLTNNTCAEQTIRQYMTKYGKDCNGDGRVSCVDYARIHKSGPHDCVAPWVDATDYWKAFTACVQQAQLT